jgi:hypothetical protein
MIKKLIQITVIIGSLTAIGLAAAFIPNQMAKAALGNEGYPVRCYGDSSGVAPGEDIFLTCITPSGAPNFVSSQRVPSGYYFYITDIVVTPFSGAAGSANITFYLFDAYGASSRASLNTYRSVDGQTLGEHFTSPLYVLTADHRLEVQAFNANQQTFEIRVYGILTTNMTYLPLAFSN